MNAFGRTLLIAGVLVTLALATTPPLQAGGYDRHGPTHRYGHAWGHDFGYRARHRYDPGYRRHYASGYRPGWGYPYGWGHAPRYGWPGYLPGHYVGPAIGLGYSSFGRHDSWGLSLSLPLYLGSSYRGYATDHAYLPAPAPYARSRTVTTYTVPAPQAPTSCLQTREYQTEITIGDEVVPAYGTACLQADGSWQVVSGPIAADY